jgi:integrase
MRFRRPDGTPWKLTLGTVDLSGKEAECEPVVGGHHSLTAARRLAADVRRQRALGRDVVSDLAAEKMRRKAELNGAAQSTFAAAARDYIELERRKKERNRGWRNTARLLGFNYPADGGEPTLVKGGLAERWGDLPVAELAADDLHAIVDEARARSVPGLPPRRPGPSDSRARDMAGTLSAMFRWLARRRRIQVNPATDLDKPAPPKARDRVLNADSGKRGADELRWFWTAASELGEPFGPLVKLLLLTGARRDEVAAMTWSELSDDLTTWSLAGNRTKNGRPHDVPLPPAVQEVLKGVRSVAGKPGYVFTTNGRSPVSGFSKVKSRLDEKMLEIASKETDAEAVPIMAWRLHDLRRTAATGMAELGVHPHIVEACLNHVSGARAGVAGTYNRAAYANEKRQALDAWAAYVLAAVEGGNVVPMWRAQA